MTRRLIMRLGRDRFAMAAEHVVRAAPALACTPLPLAPRLVEGLAVYGGDAVPQISLAATVGAGVSMETGRFVTLAHTGSGVLALRHDGFEGVREVADGQLAPVAAPPGDCRTGVFRLEGQRIYAIDARRIRIGAPPVATGARTREHDRASGTPSPPHDSPDRTWRALRCHKDGSVMLLPLDLVERVEPSGVDGFLIAMISRHGRAVLHVDRVTGLDRGRGLPDVPDTILENLVWVRDDAGEPVRDAINESAGHPVFLLKAGDVTCAVRRSDVLSVSGEGYGEISWTNERFDGLTGTTHGIVPVLDLNRRLGGSLLRGNVCVVLGSGGDVWALACDQVSSGGMAEALPSGAPTEWSSVWLDLEGGRCPLLDVDSLVAGARVA